MYTQEFEILNKEASYTKTDSSQDIYMVKELLNNRVKIISGLPRIPDTSHEKSENLVDTIKEVKIQKLISKVFGFSDFSQYEWNFIIDPDYISRNLREVELFMFDDEQVKAELFSLKQDLHNDFTIENQSSDNYGYPMIKNRFDEIDFKVIPHHWKNIDPLLYHLLVWAIIK